MRNPFPGVDPYLEHPGIWSDFHDTFVNYWREAIAERLPENYDARLKERVTLVESFDQPRKSIVPDVLVAQTGPHESRSAGRASGAAVLEPVVVPLLIPERVAEPYIEIYTFPDEVLVAVLEVLSPANKPAPDRRDYLLKRDAVLRQEVHLVELDLLRGGQRLPALKPLPPGDYYAFIAHRERRPNCNVYAWSVRQPLPLLPIPLNPPDHDIIIDLGAVYNQAYERGRYSRRLKHFETPSVPLTDDDLPWAIECSRNRS